ncbi:hypothetical protein [Massilia sp. DWR3-1-1]|uniref:hypothetical protein n=1 Tax=Massilia sp. DWR3-1-1 TaxID=2804559 RepID=UPI003CF79C50
MDVYDRRINKSGTSFQAQFGPAGPPVPPPVSAAATATQGRLVGIGLIVLAASLAYVLLLLWNTGFDGSRETKETIPVFCVLPRVCVAANAGTRILMAVMVAGALGSFIHAATSFGDFVGNDRLSANWIWWYLLRPFIAMALAAIVYLALNGGLLLNGGQSKEVNVNIYGVVALAGLVGMFTKQATDKLSEVFTTMFKTTTEGDAKRSDALDNKVPVLTSVIPPSVDAGAGSATVTLIGSGFVPGSVVRVNNKSRATVVTDATRLTATLLEEDLADGTLQVSVLSPPPGGGESASLSVRLAPLQESPVVDEDSIDGCCTPILAPTSDAVLPPARGGVAS